jgi:hypothetical protein
LSILAFSFSSFCQSSYGIRAGWNIASLKSTQGDLRGSLNSFTGGIQFDFYVKNKFSILAELDYISKGSHAKSNFALLNSVLVLEELLKINYLEIPVLAKFNFPVSKNFIHLLIGPSLGYAMNGKAKLIFNSNFPFLNLGSPFSNSTSLNFEEDNINRYDLAINMGVGISFPGNFGQLYGEIRYQLGFSNLNTANDPTLEDYRVTNSCFMITAGMLLPFRPGKNVEK